MYKKIWILIILAILILVFSWDIAAKEILSVKIELKDGTVILGEIPIILVKTKDGKFIKVEDIVSIWFLAETPLTTPVSIKPGGSTWKVQAPLILVSFRKGEETKGFDESFYKEPAETLHMQVWGMSSLTYLESGDDLQRLMESNTIFLVRPKGLKYLQDLEVKYPNLLPFSCSELESYSFPLFYFSRNVQTDKIRGVIIADKVSPSLAEILFKKELPLDTFLWYENEQLQILK